MHSLNKNHIKSIIPVFAVLLFMVLLQACSNEPVDLTGAGGTDDPTEKTDLIVNNWELKEVKLSDAFAEIEVLGSTISRPATGEGSAYDLKLVFNKDGKVSSTGSYIQSIKVDLGVFDLDESQEIKSEDFLGSGTWSRSETVLTLDNGVEVQEIQILELTENSLTLWLTTTQFVTRNNTSIRLTGTLTASFGLSGS